MDDGWAGKWVGDRMDADEWMDGWIDRYIENIFIKEY